MHVLGLGDFNIKNIEPVDDPCPVLINKKTTNSSEKEEQIKKKRTLK